MVLLPVLERATCRRTAVLGTVKNAGKTVVLNALVAEAAATGLRLGITSSGRDGERFDAVFRHPKPPIWLPAGTMVLTYERFAGESASLLSPPQQVLERHPEYGRLVLAETTKDGEIQLAGPLTRSAIAAGVELLVRAGADLTLVDGAIDRRGFIDPRSIDSIILATGMAVSPHLEVVVQKTVFWVEILRLPLWNGEPPGKNAFYRSGRWNTLEIDTALGNEERLVRALPENAETLYLQGALTDRLLLALKKEQKVCTIVLETPFACFAGPKLYRSYRRRGGKIMVRARSELLAVTTNPWGHHVFINPAKLAAAVKEAVPDLPVADVQQKLLL